MTGGTHDVPGQTQTEGRHMISENCSIDEFVDAVKEMDPWRVIALAVEEATQADRIYYRTRQRELREEHCGLRYSRHLKQLINYLRYETKPRLPRNKAWRLYITYWGADDDLPPAPTVH